MNEKKERLAAPQLSIVVPMHDEVEGMERFFQDLVPHLESTGLSWEIVCVNDGSRDSTLDCLLKIREGDERISVVDLSRNFGKDVALTAGMDYAAGRAVIPIDADLQDPPSLIPRMVKEWQKGFDVVLCRRGSRADKGLKKLTAVWFYRIFNLITETAIPEDTGDFRLMDRRVVEALQRMPERNRFMKGIFAWVGFRQTTIDFERPERKDGETKWNYRRLWTFALDGLLSFSTLPLRVWSYVGFGLSFLALLYAAWLVLRTIIFGIDVPGYASLIVVILVMGGMQFITLGIFGEYLGRIYVEVKGRPVYIVREFYGDAESGEATRLRKGGRA